MVKKKNPTGRFTRPSVRKFGFRNPVNFCLEICWNQAGKFLVEFGILEALESAILWAQGIRILLTIGIQIIQIPLTKNLESSSRNPESTAWNSQSKTVLGSLTWGRALPFYCTTCTWQPYNKLKKNNTLYLQVVGVLTYLCLLCNKLFHQAICCGEKALELRRY